MKKFLCLIILVGCHSKDHVEVYPGPLDNPAMQLDGGPAPIPPPEAPPTSSAPPGPGGHRHGPR